ncbi:MAG: C4-type zinc ribbon domain-containing protein [Anaerolineaceae bacterium]|nr:C4-type zinc ribbon domain-containing protein [Anaerolineaceae bacterium]
MSQSSDLFRLQKIDSQRDQAANRIREIDMIITADQTLRQAQDNLSAVTLSLKEAQKALQRAEELVQQQNTKIELNQAALYGGKVHNPKELQELQNESAALKRYLAVLEDQQLELMLALETAENLHRDAERQLKRTIGQVGEQQAELFGEREHLVKSIERLDAERQATSHSLPPDSIFLYEKLRPNKHGMAVTSVSEKTCDTCGHTLTPGEWQAARAPNQLSFCPSCGRILYAG